MSDTRLNRASAGLGGMAIALLLVGLVVQQARAATVCEQCHAWADQLALAECDKQGFTPYSHPQCRALRQGYRHKECYQNIPAGRTTPYCPDGSTSSLKDCGASECLFSDINAECPDPYRERGGGKTCDAEACINKACGFPIKSDGGSSGGVPGTCDQVSVLRPGSDKVVTASPCYSTCGCK